MSNIAIPFNNALDKIPRTVPIPTETEVCHVFLLMIFSVKMAKTNGKINNPIPGKINGPAINPTVVAILAACEPPRRSTV